MLNVSLQKLACIVDMAAMGKVNTILLLIKLEAVAAESHF